MSDLNLTITDREGTTREVPAKSGDLLMQVLREQVDLTLGTCGGAISCGTCLVELSPEWVDQVEPAGEDEAEMLEALGAEGNMRLSCQLVLDDNANGCQATIAPAT